VVTLIQLQEMAAMVTTMVIMIMAATMVKVVAAANAL
jgi:hypothetical protein